MEQTKRDRKKNYSNDEIITLTNEYEKYQAILESKFTNTITNAKKKSAWEKITASINAVGNTYRDAEEVKRKWTNMRSNAKTSYNERKRNYVVRVEVHLLKNSQSRKSESLVSIKADRHLMDWKDFLQTLILQKVKKNFLYSSY